MISSIAPQIFDLVVVGAGPAGLYAARTFLLAAPHRTVALLDRRDPGTSPAACAEAVHRVGFGRLFPDVPPAWVRTVIDRVVFVAPDATEVVLEDPSAGLIIDRPLFQRALADQCASLGAVCSFGRRVGAISAENRGVRKVIRDDGSELVARVVIDASGPGRGLVAKENLAAGDRDLEAAWFCLATGPEYDLRSMKMFYGAEVAPGGYGWFFPHSPGLANIGMVLGREHSRRYSVKEALTQLLARHYPDWRPLSFHGGAIPCGGAKHPLAGARLFKAGDAAGMVNPINRAGILESMNAGRLAAQAALELLESPSGAEEERKCYGRYQAAWDNQYGRKQRLLEQAKPAFGQIPDSVLNGAAHSLVSLPAHRRTSFRIFAEVLWRHPLLLWRMRSFFLG